MEYLVFPFGKYKGEKLEDLPSTYIVLALEKFELPDELKNEIIKILFGRLKVYSKMKRIYIECGKDEFENVLNNFSSNYEPTPF